MTRLTMTSLELSFSIHSQFICSHKNWSPELLILKRLNVPDSPIPEVKTP